MKVVEFVPGTEIFLSDSGCFYKQFKAETPFLMECTPQFESTRFVVYFFSLSKVKEGMYRYYVLAKGYRRNRLIEAFDSEYEFQFRQMGGVLLLLACVTDKVALKNGFLLEKSLAFDAYRKFQDCFPSGLFFVETAKIQILSNSVIELSGGNICYLWWKANKFQIVEQEQLVLVCDKVLRSNRAEALLRDIAKAKIICNEEVALMQMYLSE